MKSIEIRSKIADLTKEFRNLADNLTDENKTETESKTSEILSEIEALEVRAAQFEKVEKIEADAETRNRSRRPLADLNATVEVAENTDYADTLRSLLTRSLNSSAGSAGKTIPTTVEPEILLLKKYYSPFVDYARVIRSDNGAPLTITYSDTTSHVATVVGEGMSHGAAANSVINAVSLGGHVFTTGLLPVSKTLLADTGADIVGFVNGSMAEALGRGQNLKFTKGTGVNEPQGFITGAKTASTVSISNSAISESELIDIQLELDYAYDADAIWQMNQKTFGAIRKIKDDDGRSLIEPRLSESTPFRLLGKPIVINNDMDDIGAAKEPIAYGNFQKGFVVRFAGGIEINSYNDSTLGILGQVGFNAQERVDSKVVFQEAIIKFKMKA